MARPKTTTLTYFPFDVDFFEDDKIQLIEAEFGIKGVFITIRLLCKIYKENGYFYQWGDDQCLLFAKNAGNGIVPNLVQEVINGLIKRSFFDKEMYDSFNILTSKAIQNRFIKALERSKEILIFKEYACKGVETHINVTLIQVNAALMPQIKEKEIKVKEEKESVKKNYRFLPPSLEDIENYFSEKIKENKLSMNPKNEAVKFEAFYSSKNWFVGKNKMTDWKKAIGGWIARSNSFDNKKQIQTYLKPDFSNKFK